MGQTTLARFLKDELREIRRFQKENGIVNSNLAAEIWIEQHAKQYRKNWMEKNANSSD